MIVPSRAGIVTWRKAKYNTAVTGLQAFLFGKSTVRELSAWRLVISALLLAASGIPDSPAESDAVPQFTHRGGTVTVSPTERKYRTHSRTGFRQMRVSARA